MTDRAWRSVARAEGNRWRIDERDADGAVVGVAYREPDGGKDFVKGGKRGLIVPDGELPTYAGSSHGEPVLIAEGATDTAVLFGLGFDAVGIPMAGQCGEWLGVILAGRHVCIVADADNAGRTGTPKIARALAGKAASICVIEPPGGVKDARAAVIAGATRDDFDALIRAAAEWSDAEAEADHTPSRPAFDADAMFPGGCDYVARFASEVARSTQTPVEMAALACVAFASGCLANVVKIHGHGDHTEPPQIFALILAEPGTRKSAVFSLVSGPIHEWERDEAERLGPIIRKAATENRLREKRMSAIEAKAAKAKSVGDRMDAEAEAVELAEEIAANPVPMVPEIITSEPTPEAVAGVLQRNAGRAILASPEGDAFDIALGRYSGSKNFGVLLKAHAGDPIRAHRVGRAGDLVDRPALACCMIVQPEAVRSVWGDPQARGRGLLARFAMVWPDDGVGDRDPRADGVDERTREHWSRAIRGLLNIPVPDDGPHSVRMTPEADALLYDFQCDAERRLGYGDLANRRDFGGKLVGLGMRIALVLHGLGTWGRGGGIDAEPVSVETMRCGISWANYLADAEAHARAELTSDAKPTPHAELLAWIRERGGSATVRDVQSSLRRFRSSADKARQALRELVAAGHGVWEATEGGRTMVFRIAANTSPAGGG